LHVQNCAWAWLFHPLTIATNRRRWHPRMSAFEPSGPAVFASGGAGSRPIRHIVES
jgi:hypothetical protein